MKFVWLVASGMTSLAVLGGAACAESASNETPRADAGTDSTLTADAETVQPPGDGGVDVEVVPSKCSEAGWCSTSLPDSDLVMRDIWPLTSRAFAIAESPTLGVKVLEWDDSASTWTYIDDYTQNEPGLGAYAGKIWAPNDDEVYYGVAPGYIYHGTRPVPPAQAWSWTRSKLADHDPPATPYAPSEYVSQRQGIGYAALGVWGTSRDDVYAWFTNTIYHWKSVDGGAPEWVAEYIVDDFTSGSERTYFLGGAGTGPDDIWFSGGRSACALAVHKTVDGYVRVVDSKVSVTGCLVKPGILTLGGAPGFLTNIQATSVNEAIAIKGAKDIVKISVATDGTSVSTSNVPLEVVGNDVFYSLWAREGSLWLSGPGRVVLGTDVWNGGDYRISTIWAEGTPVAAPLYTIRGTSNSNLWAIGSGYALHKTTP